MYNSVFAGEDAFYTTPGIISLVAQNAISNDALLDWYLTNFIYMEPGVQHLWEVIPLPRRTSDPVPSNLPILMLVGGIDPATPQIFSRPSAQLLPNSFYFVITSGHATAFLPCVVEMLHVFLIDPARAPVNHCAQEYTWD